MTGSKAWYVVRTKPRRERFAQEQLVRRGVNTFLPQILDDGMAGSILSPLFPSYMFAHVHLAEQYNSIIWAPGVCRLVAFGEAPTPIDDEIVSFLQDRCGAEGYVRSEPRFREGEWVRVKRGPFEGLMGMIDGQVSGRFRVEILLEILRRQTRVSLPIGIIEHAAG